MIPDMKQAFLMSIIFYHYVKLNGLVGMQSRPINGQIQNKTVILKQINMSKTIDRQSKVTT